MVVLSKLLGGVRPLPRLHAAPAAHCLRQNRARPASTDTRGALPADAAVVVVGGGVVGTSLAYHLAKQGCEGVVLLEMAELTAGSTWHAAGLATSYHPAVNVKPIHKYSLDLFSQLERETGQAINFHTPGSLRITTTEERAEEMRYQVTRKGNGYPMCLVSPDEIIKYCPLLNKDKIKLGLYTHGDGHVDPYSLTQAYAKGARRAGALLLQGVRVTGLTAVAGGGWRVQTTRGDIAVDKVVNAAGFHARDVAALAGYKLPLVAVEHQYIVTASMPAVQKLTREFPVLRYLEASSYIRMERGGLLVGTYEYPDKMKLAEKWVKDGVPEDFSKQLFPPDLERSESYLEMVMEMIPCMQEAQIQSVVNGPITYTPDLLPMLGPHTLPDMWLAVGFGYGIIHSGGVGKYLADYMMSGEPPAELVEFDPGRFSDTWVTDSYLLAKAREVYGMNNAVGYPHEERFAGRPTSRVSTAMEAQQSRGASFLPHAGWEQPAWFAGTETKPTYEPAFRRTNWHDAVLAEARLVMDAVGVIDLTPFAKFLVKGERAAEFLSRVTANTVPRLGRCVVTHALTSRGTIYAELTVSRTAPDTFLIITGSGSEIHDLRWLQQKARLWGFAAAVSFTNVTEDQGVLSVAGPRARDVLRAAATNFPDKFPFFGVREVSIAGVQCTAIRLSYTGELGWELYHPRADTGRLYEALLHAGQPYGLNDFGTHALNILRHEKGFRGWGTEMTVDTNLVEAGMTSFINLDKGDFEGRAAVVEQLKKLPSRLLVQVAFDSPKLDPMGDEAVWGFGKVVGNTTSGCFSQHLNRSLAFCYLPPFLCIPGTTVQVEILNELHPATVLPGPPVDTHNARLARKKAKA